jgi:hypothetical protein
MVNNSHTDSRIRFNSVKRSQSQLAEKMKTTNHARRRDSRSNGQEKNIGDEEEKRHFDVKSKKEDPVHENHSQPDEQRQQKIHTHIAERVEKFQSIDELIYQLQYL